MSATPPDRSLPGLLAEGRDRLGFAADPGREARLLLAHAAGVAAHHLLTLDETGFTPDLRTRYLALVDRRARREPMSHLLGGRWFFGHWFEVTSEVLDPRPETETLVALALAAPFARVLDLGTGSGAILLSLLAGRPAATGLGTDRSAAALAVAGRNAHALGLADRAGFEVADWWQGVSGQFDLIVSNPPYIAEAEIAALAPEVRDWEPRGALTPGGDGLDAYRAIAPGLAGHLAPGGRVLVEIGPTQGQAVAALLTGAGLDEVAVHPDMDGRTRVVSGRAKP